MKILFKLHLCNFLGLTLQCFQFNFFLPMKTWKNWPKKLLIIGPIFFLSNAKSTPNLNFCFIRISHRAWDFSMMTLLPTLMTLLKVTTFYFFFSRFFCCSIANTAQKHNQEYSTTTQVQTTNWYTMVKI